MVVITGLVLVASGVVAVSFESFGAALVLLGLAGYRSAAQGDLCHEAPALPVARSGRSSATRSIDMQRMSFLYS